MKAVTSSWSKGSIVPQRAASAELCDWEERQAVLLAGFTAESCAVNVFCRGAAFSSSVLFMQTAESERKVRHLINRCGCGSVSYVFLRAHIQRQNRSARGYRIFFLSSEILSKLWPLNFSLLFPFPYFILCCQLHEICFPLTSCCQYTKWPHANTTSPCSEVPYFRKQQRNEKIKVASRSLKLYFQTAHDREWKQCSHR